MHTHIKLTSETQEKKTQLHDGAASVKIKPVNCIMINELTKREAIINLKSETIQKENPTLMYKSITRSATDRLGYIIKYIYNTLILKHIKHKYKKYKPYYYFKITNITWTNSINIFKGAAGRFVNCCIDSGHRNNCAWVNRQYHTNICGIRFICASKTKVKNQF